MSLKSELQEVLYNYWATHRFCEDGCQSVSDKDGEGTVEAILDLLDKSLPSHKRQVHVEHGEIMPSVAQCKWYFDGYEQALADVRKVIKEEL